MLKSHSGFQRLRKCVVGRSYPPEFYSWITNARLRNLFEKIAIETEEDYQSLIKKLKEFDIDIIRPNTLNELFELPDGWRIPGPYSMTPRDSLCMIGETLYQFDPMHHANKASGNIKYYSKEDRIYKKYKNFVFQSDFFSNIREYAQSFGNRVITASELPDLSILKANNIVRLGDTLYLGADQNVDPAQNKNLQNQFKDYNIKSVTSKGHIDGMMCPVKPGLLMSIVDPDIEDYKDTFPGWEVCWLTGENQWRKIKDWRSFKKKTNGKWWIKGYENDNELIDFVETWLQDWVGYVEETVFDVNALVINEKNIIVSGYNKTAFDAFERHGVTAHIVPFRHRYFWDGGIHCNTLDLDRDGNRINYFTEETN